MLDNVDLTNMYVPSIYRLPKCKPMDTLVKVELPEYIKNVEKIVPSHTLLPRCSGLHTGECGPLILQNEAKKCVSNLKHSKEIKVVYNFFKNI